LYSLRTYGVEDEGSNHGWELEKMNWKDIRYKVGLASAFIGLGILFLSLIGLILGYGWRGDVGLLGLTALLIGAALTMD